MMITDLIREDHLAARDLLGVIGNSPQQAHEERADGFARLAALWAIHGNMMTAAVHPVLGATQAWPDPVAATTELQQEVETLAGDLARREDRHDASWRGEYEHLRDTFERQVQVEQTDLIPLLLELPPEQIAKATETARSSRAGG
ncbi:hemerythrin domain-containing protein [Indioceanicola profundi]|uniref:hemerythrin domain-containing protein n=1 Tax=Indioceanicola profundi TaxID=2220096 RepID=UPI000E6AE06A|nr:hemerythrin domain-containing protein [Indioceanicola profundi]